MHSIIKEKRDASKKIRLIEKNVGERVEVFKTWMAEYANAISEEYVKDLNSSGDCWDPIMFQKLMASISMMTVDQAERFFDFCRTWAMGSNNWPGDYIMHRAKEE